MRVLGIDTATMTASVALVDEHGTVLASAESDPAARNADLLVVIDRICSDPTTLDAVAIGAGPGSFTGLRIGMATAKGIAFAAGTPLWSVSSLAALARDARQPGLVVAVLDARRGEVFAACYRDGVLVGQERVCAPEAIGPWVTELGEAAVYVGDAIVTYAETFAGLPWLAARTPSGASVAALALTGSRTDVLSSGAPAYIRPAEAELMYPDGVPGALRRH